MIGWQKECKDDEEWTNPVNKVVEMRIWTLDRKSVNIVIFIIYQCTAGRYETFHNLLCAQVQQKI